MKKAVLVVLVTALCGVMFPSCNSLFPDEVDEEDEAFYMAIVYGTPEDVENLLKQGHDPNYMNRKGLIKWVETNPLWSICSGDDEKTRILIQYGANVTKRPYLGHMIDWPILSTRLSTEMKEYFFKWEVPLKEEKVYQTTKLLLEAGASPNLKGRGDEPPRGLTTDAECLRWYDEHGYTPINSAIELNLFSIVDLLLEYGATLDENSLEFARVATEWSGGNTEMQVKIQAIWDATH